MILPFACRKPIYDVFKANEDVLIAAIEQAAKLSAEKMGKDASKLFSKGICRDASLERVAA